MRAFAHGERLRQVIWNVADQGLSSASNLLLSVAVAREVSRAAFGRFALTIGIYAVVLVVVRATAGQTLLLVQAGGAKRANVPAYLGVGALVGTAGSMTVAVAAEASGSRMRPELLVLALVLVPVCVQDVTRYGLFAAGRAAQAFVADLLWTVLQVAAMVALTASGAFSVSGAILLWGASGTASAAYGLVALRSWPAPADGLRALRLNRALCLRSTGDGLLAAGPPQLLLFVVAALLGTEDVAALRGVTVLFGPLTLLFSATRSGLLAQLATIARRSPERLPVAARLVSLGTVGATLPVVLVLVFLPSSVGSALIGSTWHVTRRLVPVIALQYLITAACEGSIVGTRALAAAQRGLRGSVAYGIATLVAGIVGAASFGVLGIAWSYVAVAVFGFVVFSVQFRRSLREGARTVLEVGAPLASPEQATRA